MYKKKIAAAVLACAMLTSLGSVSASAACRNNSVCYELCSVDDCNKTSIHSHDGFRYLGHSIDDGHDYHQVCSVSTCTKTGTHTHKGVSYMGHHDGDGHDHCQNNSGGHHRSGRHH